MWKFIKTRIFEVRLIKKSVIQYLPCSVLSYVLLEARAGAQPIQAMEIQSLSLGGTYRVYMNDEPVGYADGEEFTVYRGFPIHTGTNIVRVVVNFPSDYHSPMNFPPKVYLRFVTQEAKDGKLSPMGWDKLDLEQDEWVTLTPFEYTNDFEMDTLVTPPAFQELPADDSALKEQCRQATIFLASVFRRQDYKTLAKLFHMKESDLTNETSRNFISLPITNDFVITCETNDTNLEVETGKHLLLVHAKPGHHIMTFTNPKGPALWAKDPVSKFHHEGENYLDSFAFGRINGKWELGGTIGPWREFDMNSKTDGH
jgi:hypothetical protein